MQDHGVSRSNHSISHMPGRALWVVKAICFASLAYAPPALAEETAAGAASLHDASARRSATGTTCRVDVRSKPVAGVAKHLFVIYSTGRRELYFRGGPSDDGGGSDSNSRTGSSGSKQHAESSHGSIVTNHGVYKSGTVDYAPRAPSVTVLTGVAACGLDRCFAREAARINGLRIPYKILGPNSNSAARTFLAKCGVPARKPAGVAPGWNRIL